jgi:hypothetical protein
VPRTGIGPNSCSGAWYLSRFSMFGSVINLFEFSWSSTAATMLGSFQFAVDNPNSKMEQARLRDAIDYYARIAQLSPLFPILLWAAFAYGESLQNNFNLVPAASTATSPSTSLRSTRSAHRAWFRIRWWLGGAVFLHYGTRIEWFLGISWASWLALLAVLDTNSGEFQNR